MTTADIVKPGEPPRPKLHAMLVCDQVIKDEKTKNSSLIGVFNSILAAGFPASHARLTVYVSVIDAQGSYHLRLELVRMSDDMAIGRGEADVSVGDRFLPAEWMFELRGLTFEQPGEYEFRLWVNDRFLGSKSLSVVQLAGE